MEIAKVYIEYSSLLVNRPFDYIVKEGMDVCKGKRVSINFNNASIVGYVSEVITTSLSKEELEKEYGYALKEIEAVLDKFPLINEEINEIVHYLEKETLSPLIKCYQSVLPPSLKPSSSNTHVSILKDRYYRLINKDIKLNKSQEEIVNCFLNNKELKYTDLEFSKSRLDTLVKKGVLEEFYKEKYRDLKLDYKDSNWNKLTKEQEKALEAINNSENRVILLEGVTGSGKTEIYLTLAKEALGKGKNVLILVPEISLTPLIIKRFKERFKEDIAIFHSGLSVAERYDQYRKIVSKEVRIVIGTRSAIFMPLENLGLIVLDEEHSESYKQDNAPSYHAKDIAIFRANYHKCKLILGSATPSLESKVRAFMGQYSLVKLEKRINNFALPTTKIIDLNEELLKGNFSLFSEELLRNIQEKLSKKEQVILLLNKRGYGSFVSCKKCHYVFKCPNCGISLNFHKSDYTLKCHYCGFSLKYPKNCPSCQSSSLTYSGLGTQKVEEELRNLLSDARIVRMDFDTTLKKDAHRKILEAFENHEYDILIGTQMIAKGLDFPLVTLVGVINADIGLNANDFRANERTFQLLTQVIGRSGRDKREGKALIQTYNPNNFVLQLAKDQDYENFFKNEIVYRKKLNYPPFMMFSSLIFKSKSYEQAFLVASNFKKYLNERDNSIIVLGPSIPYIEKDHGSFRVRLMIKYKDKQKTLKLVKELIESSLNNKVSISIIIDPYQEI